MFPIADMINVLYSAFDFFNEQFYDNELETPIISIQREKRNTILGSFGFPCIWKDLKTESEYREINLNPVHFTQSPYEIMGVLLHEMVHLYNYQNGINDTNGRKHNKKFAREAERVMLKPMLDDDDWSYTGVTSDLITLINNNFNSFETFKECMIYYVNIENEDDKEKKPRKKTMFTYTCPKCGMTVKAKADKNIICGECGLELEMEETEDMLDEG